MLRKWNWKVLLRRGARPFWEKNHLQRQEMRPVPLVIHLLAVMFRSRGWRLARFIFTASHANCANGSVP